VVRVVKCIVRTDLIPELDGGFCTAPPGTGTIRANIVAQQGFSGTGQFYEIVFAQAPDATAGKHSAVTITVENFVSVDEIPIPTTVRDGEIKIICPLPAPILAIARSAAQVELTWLPITVDLCGKAVKIASYEIWRDRAPYTVTASAPGATATGATLSFTEPPPAPEELLRVYRVLAVANDGRRSPFSNTEGAFSYRLVPGSMVTR
jgi:hypothetical protein